MSPKFCLPISFKPAQSGVLSIVLVTMYALPLLPVYIYLEFGFAAIVTVICIGLCGWDLYGQTRSKNVDRIYINQTGKWYLLDEQGEFTDACMVSNCRIGPVLFLLIAVEGHRFRVMVFDRAHDPQLIHKLRVYLNPHT